MACIPKYPESYTSTCPKKDFIRIASKFYSDRFEELKINLVNQGIIL